MARADKRKVILDAAEKLFLSGRFDRITLEQVRLKAKVGKGTIYRYFEDKEDLYAQVILSGLDDFYASLQEKASEAGSPDSKLVAIAQGLRVFYRKRSRMFRSFFTVEFRRMLSKRRLHDELMKRHRRIGELVGGIIEEGMKAGTYRKDLPARAAAGMFLSLVRGGMRSRDPKGPRPLPVKRIVSLFLDGVRKR